MSEPENVVHRRRAFEQRGPKPFPISRIGWMGIAMIVVALAYFLLPDKAPDQEATRREAPATKVEATQPARNQYEIVSPAPPPAPAEENTAAGKREERATTKAEGRTEPARSAGARAGPEAQPALSGASRDARASRRGAREDMPIVRSEPRPTGTAPGAEPKPEPAPVPVRAEPPPPESPG